MSRRAAMVVQALCYDDAMADVVSPHAAKSHAAKPGRRHTFVPATAEQISKGVGVTKKDAALVRKVLLQLGYIKEEMPTQRKARQRTKAEQG